MGHGADKMVTRSFLFPGQGSQFVGMGKNIYKNFSEARHIFKEAEETLTFHLGRLCFEGPESDLKLTKNTQPAILTVSTAVYCVLSKETGIKPRLVVGHSLGEYSALVASGALRFSDAVALVRERGRAMQEAVPVGKGAMAALIGAEASPVIALCKEVTQSFGGNKEFVSPANFNGGGQIVVSGTREAVKKCVDMAPQHNIRRAKLLNVSAPFHCALMQPAAEHMAKLLETISISALKIPYIANVDGKIHTDETGVRDRLVRQIPHPVLWEASMQRLKEEGVVEALELGPGKVLTGLLRKINKEIKSISVQTAEDIKSL